MKDSRFLFSSQQAIADGTAVDSSVYDAGAVTRLFGGDDAAELVVEVTAATAGGDDYVFACDFVGTTDTDGALDTSIEKIATINSGVMTAAALAAALPLVYVVKLANQKADKRTYGLIYDLAGTTPTATVNAYIRQTGGARQSNLIK